MRVKIRDRYLEIPLIQGGMGVGSLLADLQAQWPRKAAWEL